VPGMTRRRLELWGDPDQLAGFDPSQVLERARLRLRELRRDVELTHIEQNAPDSVRVVMLARQTVRDEDIDEIAEVLREALGIGTGPTVLLPEAGDEEVRGIGGSGRTCPTCGLPDGTHSRGCPNGPR
jgi:hypothetical protein